MTKDELAKQINKTANIMRTISLDHKLNLKVGELYDNQSHAESWSDAEASSQDFDVEQDRKYEYTFLCDGVSVHAVDYENEEETELLGATGCENEGEALVPADTKMRIVSVANDEDAAEMGYYEVQLEVIK